MTRGNVGEFLTDFSSNSNKVVRSPFDVDVVLHAKLVPFMSWFLENTAGHLNSFMKKEMYCSCSSRNNR